MFALSDHEELLRLKMARILIAIETTLSGYKNGSIV